MLVEVPRTQSAPELARITDAEAHAMVRAVLRLFEHWQVSDNQARDILGGLAARTYARWKAGEVGRIDRDLATRLSLLMGIHKGLRYLFSDAERGYAWVKKPNAIFAGQTPVDIMAAGDIFSLARVRSWLDAERGG
ncbi:MbcA/ParS/Xre antitoxin family protein [Devosia sp. XJ19-1]|uniref:MbcA/ParS/Xre antitoxin family protein n=1 Tax=Devosia ureilytica TaxID=2952754 RepID=A0A9Q4APC9_9HYPH|nr:MbcA/ParS/Xre antitoxin family protein [Devosia ureilytica]MCP8884300.1 MbcA/ParS/Xre antitoxin family protein [Devosia ureilytica]MCP8887908.1 MbcA/ParS/Xre antitoxin family protein [Devosia ureilytica]